MWNLCLLFSQDYTLNVAETELNLQMILSQIPNVFLFLPDARVRDYPLMQSPVQMTTILMAYVFFSVYVGPRLMANRKPFRLNTAMIIYNLSMVLLNAYIVVEVRKTTMINWLFSQLVVRSLVLTKDVGVYLTPSSWCQDGGPPTRGDVTLLTPPTAHRLLG